MKYFEVTLSRVTEDEIIDALQEKLDDDWELSKDITPVFKESGSGKDGSGTYSITKYVCCVRKEERLARAGRKITN